MHFNKREFCFSEVDFLGVMVGREGTRPALSKGKTQELETPPTVGTVRAFLPAQLRPRRLNSDSTYYRPYQKQRVQLEEGE